MLMGIINVLLTAKPDILCNDLKKYITCLLLREKYFWITFMQTMKAMQRRECCCVCNKAWVGLIGILSCNNPYLF